MPSISAVILTLNEEKNLQRCLNSLKGIADEVIVMDSFSSDGTREIAEKFGARFITEKWKGYAAAKNHAASLATNPIFLFIDADEELSTELRESILKEKDNLNGAYSYNRLNNYCGKWIRFGGFYPDRKIRLYTDKSAIWVGDFVHEKVACKPGTKITHLQGDLLHFSYSSHEEHKQRLEKYARLGAEALRQSGASYSWLKKYISPAWKFFKHYFFKMGFLDGSAGYWIAFYSAKEVHLKYKYAAD